mmetsp:Transcript_7506/g.21257  ORF Transcript_7506/g.21257 Transcript_7506/m.21257 type:complete len:163 (+) Transcript_7506:512-1000(+)
MLLNVAVGVAAKEIIQQPRPSTCHALSDCDTHGMPSSHSQCISFAALVFISLAVQRPAPTLPGRLWQGIQGTASVAVCGAVAWSRVYLGYHSLEQVIAGLLVGAAVGGLWAWGVAAAGRALPEVEGWPICQRLGLRDSSHLPDLVAFGRQAVRSSREAMKKD